MLEAPVCQQLHPDADAEEGAAALRARFLHSQSFSQDDPWAERAAGQHAELHQHLQPIAIAAE